MTSEILRAYDIRRGGNITEFVAFFATAPMSRQYVIVFDKPYTIR